MSELRAAQRAIQKVKQKKILSLLYAFLFKTHWPFTLSTNILGNPHFCILVHRAIETTVPVPVTQIIVIVTITSNRPHIV